MKCFHDFKKIKTCPKCNYKIDGHICCDNDCGTFDCDNCNQEYWAQYLHNLTPSQIPKEHWKIEIKKGNNNIEIIIVANSHNPYCGDDGVFEDL
jgi:hypothetical protein